MTLLLDTCTLIWAVAQPRRLSTVARRALESRENRLLVSAISGFEVGLLHRLNQVHVGDVPAAWFEAAVNQLDATVRAVTWQVALRCTQLPLVHRDPADRIIIVTAMDDDAQVLTPDPHIARYPGVRVIW